MQPTARPFLAKLRTSAAAETKRYTDRRTSFFSLGCFRHWGFDDALGVFGVSVGIPRAPSNIRAICRGSPSALSGGVFSSGGAGWLRRISAVRNYRAQTGPWFLAGRAAVGSSGGAGSSNVLSMWGSFEGPYNIRLHLTAPREHCSHSVRGESRDIEYGTGARVQTISIGSSGGRVRVRTTRRACDSPRPERTRGAAGEPERWAVMMEPWQTDILRSHLELFVGRPAHLRDEGGRVA